MRPEQIVCPNSHKYAEVTRLKSIMRARQLRGGVKLNKSVQVMLHFALSPSDAAFCGKLSFDPIIMHAMQPSAKWCLSDEKRKEVKRGGKGRRGAASAPEPGTALPPSRQGLHFLPRACVCVFSLSFPKTHLQSSRSASPPQLSLFWASNRSDICEWWRLIWHEMVIGESQISKGRIVQP